MKPFLFLRHGLLLPMATLTLTLVGPSLLAQPPGIMPEETPGTERQTQRHQRSELGLPLQGAHRLSQLSELMDQPVRNRQGEEVGNLRDFVIDAGGQVRYAVLGHGGVLGVGEQWTAINWKLLEIAPEGDHFLLEVTEEQLAGAPTFDNDNWPTEPQVSERGDWTARTGEAHRRGQETTRTDDIVRRRAERIDSDDSKTVTLRGGETLSTLAELLYGKPEMWKQIYEANRDKIDDPDHVPAGTRLILPNEPRR